jgi:gamma-glutamyltranspeptidase/glutathione hydrolase
MVSSTQPLANEAGYKILAAGGNAADAAVAMAAALNVTEPSSTGIGGDMFCLYFDGKTKSIKALNGSGRAPAALSIAKLRELGVQGSELGFDSIHAATVPGACAGWFDTLELFGSGKVDMQQVLAPAIDLARNGFPVSEISAYQWEASESFIKKASPNANEILSKTRKGHAPRAGEMMRNPTLADTFETIAKGGKDAFYKGRIAEAIVELVQSRGGVMTLEDLASHTSTPCDPISTEYAGLNVWEHPPNGQGIIALICLGLLREMQESGQIKSLSDMEHNSAEYLHAIIECLRLAFADGRYYVTDPRFMKVTPEELLSPAYLRKRAQIFNAERRADIEHGSPANSSDTVYFSVVDKDGNACSFIISNYAGFGTAAVPKGCGFTLQNRGCNFVLREGHPNMLEGGKRPYHTIVPAMVTRQDGSLWASFACMGAWMQMPYAEC